MMGVTKNPTYREVCTKKTNHSEVTRIVYDPKLCPLTKILKIFFETHDPTQELGQGNDRGSQYRSGLYYYNERQKAGIDACLEAYQGALTERRFGKIKTEVLPAEKFYYAEEHHQQYDAKPGNREYCGLRPLGVNMPEVKRRERDDSTEVMDKKDEGADPEAKGTAKRLFPFKTLQSSDGKRITVSKALNGKVIAYYHSAHWCRPCKAFTPKLAEIYKSLTKEEREAFEVVWRSNDTSEEEFKGYFSTMPWLAIPYSQRSKAGKNANKFIPSLVIYAPNGKGISKDGVKEISKDMIRKWCKLDEKAEGSDKRSGSGDINDGLDTNKRHSKKKKPSEIPVIGSEFIMSEKSNGTTSKPPMRPLRWGLDWKKANKICCFNRHFAERAGYFRKSRWMKEVDSYGVTVYYDSVTAKPLFRAPIGRTFRQFLLESEKHGWPSFRDPEVIWDDVRVLKNGEVVSLAGTHLGHNLPDHRGNRYCINLVSIAGIPNERNLYKSESTLDTKFELVSLNEFLVKGHVDYAKLRTEEGRAKLSQCVAYVERTDVTRLKSQEVLCFYLNAYNIICLKSLMEVLDRDYHYEGHTTIARRYLFFVKTEHLVSGSNISLHDLENSVLRNMGDPRIHSYLNCGAMSCPHFPDVWLTPENLDKELERRTYSWIVEQGAVIITAKPSEATASKAIIDGKTEAKEGGKEEVGPVAGTEGIMAAKEHGSCERPPMNPLRWNCDFETADRITCFNRHYAEFAGYWLETSFPASAKERERQNQPITFYDSVYGFALFKAPLGRSWGKFMEESTAHGWPSFRDNEVLWEHVRVLENGEVVSDKGSHLGHNLPDSKGNRYCINLVSIAGREPGAGTEKENKKSYDPSKEGGVVDIKTLLLTEFAQENVKDRRYLFKKYPKCFVGKDLVDWLVTRKELMVENRDQTRMLTRPDAVAIAQDLLNTGFFSHVLGEHVFEDKHLFYRFQRDGGAQRKLWSKSSGPLLLVSSLFKWYRADYQPKYGGLFGFMREYHPKLKNDKHMAKLSDKDISFRFQLQDWRLNSVENGRKIKPLLFGAKPVV
eukprot:CAMPEP_0184492174 /NCGR_PEP_ID=MMETSP0113_2-20130426/22481_1 /TAXON_ID=91329 /ORGANISM="Norrisiella sphaerica, Strain BC52" /LENGTH=1054 /DNA_ID=CAMNT_0026876841 /DNA_START=337 /DNA_END=3501 /DNA_ORIENTATION=-